MTINDSWGFQHADLNFKTPYEVISIFADVISKGGNLLLDFGPREDGTIPEKSLNVLKELGKWNKKHSEAVFATTAGLPNGHFFGPTTLSKDSMSVFLFLTGNPTKPMTFKGLDSEIDSISVVGSDQQLKWKTVGKISWSPVPGIVYIEPPASNDDYMTVLKISLKTPLKLYRGEGGLGL